MEKSEASNGFLSDGLQAAKKSENGEEELCDLDAVEFDLPPVDGVPSLEEILKQEPDFTPLDESELSKYFDLEGDSSSRSRDEKDIDDTSTVSSLPSTVHSAHSRINECWKRPKKVRKKSEILRFAKLRGISSQLHSAADRIQAGAPTALAVFTAPDRHKNKENLIAVGTAHGLVMVFHMAEQALKYCLGTAKNGQKPATAEFGRVAAISFNQSGAKLLIGYSKGHVQLVDSAGGRVVMTLRPDQVHQSGHGILHLQFTEQPSTAICVDSGGSVFELKFTGSLVGLTSRTRCIFSGSRGEVCAVSTLMVPQKLLSTCKHYSEPGILAMASMTKVIVICLKPNTNVVFASPLSGPPDCPPLLCWQWVPIQITAKVRIVDPVLTFCRNSEIHFYQIHTADGQRFKWFCLQKVVLNFVPIHLQWLNARCVIVLDDKEQIHLHEAGIGDGALETISGSEVQLVYGSSDFKGLATGGNVSPALACLAEKACYQSMVSDGAGKVYLLGLKGVFSVSLRSWLERVDVFVAANDLVGALHLVLDFYTGRVKLGTAGSGRLGGGAPERFKPIISDKAVDLLMDYVDKAMSIDCPMSGKIEVLQEHYKIVVPVCVDACATLSRFDLLYGPIYDRFAQDILARGFFLECLEEFLLDGSLPDVPPVLIQDYLTHLEEEGLLGTIETSVVRLPIESLDIHQVMTLCRAYKLYDGIIYVHNQALKDYISPLKEMLLNLNTLMAKNEFLSDEDILLGNKILLYLSCCLCGRAYPVGSLPEDEAKTVSGEVFAFLISETVESIENCAYPYLRVLLRFDTREFLNVLSMAFNSEYFSSDAGCRQCQKVVDILLEIVLKDCDFNAVQMGAFFTFVARVVVLQNGNLSVGKIKFHQLLEAVLCSGEVTVGTSSYEERQQAVLDLLESTVGQKLLDADVILKWAEKGKYLQICEFLYWKKRDFGKIIHCYLDDTFKMTKVFTLMRQLIGGSDLLNSEKLAVKQEIQNVILEFAKADARQTAEFFLDFMENSLNNLPEKMESDPACFLELLREMFSYRSSTGQNCLCSDEKISKKLAEKYVGLMCKEEKNGTESSSDILRFIRDWEDYTKDNETILRICREEKVVKPTVYLLEQRGAFEEAFEVLNETMKEALVTYEPDKAALGLLISTARELLSFCRRSPETVGKARRETFWFALLGNLLNIPTHILTSATEVKDLLSDTVHAMINYVEPAEVLERLYKHPAFQVGVFSEYQDLINTILKSYDYEEVLLNQTIGAIHGDVHGFLEHSFGVARKAVASTEGRMLCGICGARCTRSKSRKIVIFECRHGFHTNCMSLLKNSEADWICPTCNKRKIDQKSFATIEDKTSPVLTGRKVVQKRKVGKLKMLEGMNEDRSNPFATYSDQGTEGLFSQHQFPLRLAPPKKYL